MYVTFMYIIVHTYWPSLKSGSNQLIVTPYILSIYPSVHNQQIRTIFEGRQVYECEQMPLDLDRHKMDGFINTTLYLRKRFDGNPKNYQFLGNDAKVIDKVDLGPGYAIFLLPIKIERKYFAKLCKIYVKADKSSFYCTHSCVKRV